MRTRLRSTLVAAALTVALGTLAGCSAGPSAPQVATLTATPTPSPTPAAGGAHTVVLQVTSDTATHASVTADIAPNGADVSGGGGGDLPLPYSQTSTLTTKDGRGGSADVQAGTYGDFRDANLTCTITVDGTVAVTQTAVGAVTCDATIK
jgi:uncharacterized protein (DUF58 family)